MPSSIRKDTVSFPSFATLCTVLCIAVGVGMYYRYSHPLPATIDPKLSDDHVRQISACGKKNPCNKIAFGLDLPQEKLTGFRYEISSDAIAEGGCMLKTYTIHSSIKNSEKVMGVETPIDDGGKATVVLSNARVEIYCDKGQISRKDVTKKKYYIPLKP